MNTIFKWACVGGILLAVASGSRAPAAVRNLPGFSANVYGPNDDGTYPCTSLDPGPPPPGCMPSLVPIGFTVNFYGASFGSLYVNNNGNVTFDSPLSEFTPFGLAATAVQIIAPFFADVDTRVGNVVTFGNDVVDGHAAFGVNWISVGYYDSHTDKLNSFQLILIQRSDRNPGDFDIEFNYDQVQWETGDASGGTGGLGGSSAVVGFSNGSALPGTFFQLHGSAIPGQFLDSNPGGLVHRSLSSTVPGRYVIPILNLTNTVLNVPLFSQGDSHWGSNTYGNSSFTIQQKGCALASLAMVLKYAGVNTDPGALNTLLKADNDFVGTSLNWTAAARDASNGALQFHAFRTSDLQYLSQSLANGNPVVVGVNLDENGAPGHFVVVRGYQNGQFLINDPGHANYTSLAQYNNSFETRGYVAAATGNISGLGISVDDPAELLVVDASGRRCGYAANQVLEEIPQGSYFQDRIEASDLTGTPGADTAHLVDVYQPALGTYQVFLQGVKTGTYKLTLRSFSQSGVAGAPLTFSGSITSGAVAPFQVYLGSSGLTSQPFTNQCPWSADPTTGPLPLNVQFTAPSVDPGGNSIMQWNWTFGDGSSSNVQNPPHTYGVGGIYFPSLTAINSLGATLVGSGPAIVLPAVRFTASPINGSPPLTVQFNCPAVDNLGSPLTHWLWDFGDGTTSTQQNPTHNYVTLGAFTPTLIATNSNAAAVDGSGPRITVLESTGLIFNGGFETGDFTGWTLAGDTLATFVDTDPSDVHSGAYGVAVGATTPSTLSQTIPTTPGKSYLISLWLDSPDGQTPTQVSVTWGPSTLLALTDLPAFGWTNIQLLATATTASTILRFGLLDEPSYLGLDDISVFPVQPTIISLTLSGSDLVFKAANCLAGRSYRVLQSNRATLPLAQWTPLSTNTPSASGNFSFTVPNAVDPAAAQRFYILQLQ